MKRKLSIILTIVFLFSLSAVAFAKNIKQVATTENQTELMSSSKDQPASSSSSENQDAETPVPLETKLTAPKLTIYTGDELTITATTIGKAQGQFDSHKSTWTGVSEFNPTVLDSEKNFVSTATFKSEVPGTFAVTYKLEMDAGNSNNQGSKFVGQGEIKITVISKPAEKKVVDFEIAEAKVDDQDNGNTKQALYISKLNVTYSDGSIEKDVKVEFKIGNIYSKEDRKFDVTYEGVTKQFEASAILEKIGKPYPGPQTETVKPSKPEKAAKPVKPEKPAK